VVDAEGEWRGLVELIKPISGPFQQQKKPKKRTTPSLFPSQGHKALDDVIEEPALEAEAESDTRRHRSAETNTTSHLLSSAHEAHQANLKHQGAPSNHASNEMNALFSALAQGSTIDAISSSLKNTLSLSIDSNLKAAGLSVQSHSSGTSASLAPPRRAPSFTASTSFNSNSMALNISHLQSGLKQPPLRIMSLLTSSVGGFGSLLTKQSSSLSEKKSSNLDDVGWGSPPERLSAHAEAGPSNASRLSRPHSMISLKPREGSPGPRIPSCDNPLALTSTTERSTPEGDTGRPISMVSVQGKGSVHTFVSGRRLSISMMTPFGSSMLSSDKQSTVWHEIVAAKIPHPTGQGSVVILMQSDVTQRTQLEASIVELSEAQCSMLSSVFPRHIIEFLSLIKMESIPAHIAEVARTHENVTIMFMDIVGFTSMSKEVNANQVMTLLNTLFTMFDKLAGAHKVHKVETAGDCYIVAGGILEPAEQDGFSE
jgi:hypothetical protein